MEVVNIEEQEDGSALVTLNMTDEENNIFVGFAVNRILKDHIEKIEQESIRTCFHCGDEINDETLKEFPDTEICSECMD